MDYSYKIAPENKMNQGEEKGMGEAEEECLAREKIREISAQISQILEEIPELESNSEEYQAKMKMLWELSKQRFVACFHSEWHLEKYKGIIFTVGYSPEPIILSILANEPECVFFIHTRETERILDEIIEQTGLKPSQYKREGIERVSAAGAYDLVKRGIKFLVEKKNIEKNRIAIDPTGGTKIMSVGCGIAASVFNLNILYVNNQNYNPKLRRPEPGSEILVSIPNPFDIFQDDKLIDGLKYFLNFKFNIAVDTFNLIKQSSNNPLFPELLANLANLLFHWNAIDYKRALSFLDKTRNSFKQLGERVAHIQDEFLHILDQWEHYLSEIHDGMIRGEKEVEKISPLLIHDILKNAEREFFDQAYNNAALKYYRTIEMINQYILFTHHELNTQDPDYSRLKWQGALPASQHDLNQSVSPSTIEQALLNKYNETWRFIYQKQGKAGEFKEQSTLPRKIGLVAGTILRSILGENAITKQSIFNLLQIIEKRNQSIYAHGITSIKKSDCEKLKKCAEQMLKVIKIPSPLKNYVFNQKMMQTIVDLFIQVL